MARSDPRRGADIKDPNAETTRQTLRLKARQRLCLSGTPLQNHLGELWSLFDFIAPGFLGTQKGFRTRYRTPIEKHGDPERQALLARRVRPFLLRRTKEEVARNCRRRPRSWNRSSWSRPARHL